MSRRKNEGVSKATKIVVGVLLAMLIPLVIMAVYLIQEIRKPVEITASAPLPAMESESEISTDDEPSLELETSDPEEKPDVGEKVPAGGGEAVAVTPFGELTPEAWELIGGESQYMVVITSVYCQPCLNFKDETLLPYQDMVPDAPLYLFEVGDYPERYDWLVSQAAGKQIVKELDIEGIPTPTVMFMRGHELIDFHAGKLPLDSFLELVEGQGYYVAD